jgi:hypothetical protein
MINVGDIRDRFLMNLHFINRFSKKIFISNFTKIRPVGAELFHAEEKTDGQTRRNEANRPLLQFCECA